MKFKRHESFAIGEFLLFVATWLLALATTMDDYSGGRSEETRNTVAASGDELELREFRD